MAWRRQCLAPFLSAVVVLWVVILADATGVIGQGKGGDGGVAPEVVRPNDVAAANDAVPAGVSTLSPETLSTKEGETGNGGGGGGGVIGSASGGGSGGEEPRSVGTCGGQQHASTAENREIIDHADSEGLVEDLDEENEKVRSNRRLPRDPIPTEAAVGEGVAPAPVPPRDAPPANPPAPTADIATELTVVRPPTTPDGGPTLAILLVCVPMRGHCNPLLHLGTPQGGRNRGWADFGGNCRDVAVAKRLGARR